MKSSKKLNVTPRIDTSKSQLIEHLRDGYVLLTIANNNPTEITGVVVFSETEGVNVGTTILTGAISACNLFDGEINISN